MSIPNWLERFLRNVFFFGPERVDKFRRIFILVLIGVLFFLIIHFIAIAFVSDEQRGTALDIAFGLIPEFVGSVAVYWVLDSSIKQLYGISELPDLPLDSFIGELHSAKQIRILETFTRLATDSQMRKKFCTEVKDALRNGAEVQILLIHPYSEGAKQRAEELARAQIDDVHEQIQRSLAQFYKLQKEVSSDQSIDNSQRNFQIRLYDASPAIAMHMWDRDAYLSFFPVKQRSDDAPNLKISMATTFGHYAAAKFDELWNHGGTIPLSSHMELKVVIPGEPPEEMLYCLRVTTDDSRTDIDTDRLRTENGLSFYVTNHFSNTLQEVLETACLNKDADVQLTAEGVCHMAICEKLTSTSTDNRKAIIEGYRRKYDWNLEETDEMIREDPIIYKVKLSKKIDVT